MGFTAGYKVNENTDYEFTVSDETIQEIVQGDGITESDIADYCYTALHDSRINALHVETSSAWSYGPSEFDGWVEDDCAFRLFRGIPIPTLNKALNEPVTDVYERNLLTWYGTIYPGTENEKTGTFLVMDMKDIKKWYAEYTATMFSPTSVASTATKYGQTSTAPGYTGSCYTYVSNTVVNYSIEPAEEVVVDGTLRFLNVFVLNDELWVGLLNPSSHGEAQTMHSVNSWYYGGNNFVKGYLNVNDPSDKLFQRGTTGYYGVSLIPDLEYESAVDTDLQTYPEGANGIIMYGNCVNSQINLYSGDYAKDLDTVLTWQSWCGLKFKFDNTMYKPIIQGGVIVGYSDDMDAESEYDNMTNVTGNNISPTPPLPPPPPPSTDDDMDIMNTGATGSSGGFTHFYIMSPQDLIDLLSDFYTHADAGETLSNNLVCSYILGIPSSAWAATENVPVAIHNSAQGTPFVSVANYTHVTATNNILVTGTFDVPRMTNTFYDFSPYSTYEVFIPCCGWVRLPDTVAGRTINVYLYLDIASCCVKGQVMISGAGVCAVVNGALGSPIPMAVIESGILRGNNIQAGMGMIGGAIQTGVSAGNGNSMGIGLGAERILSGLVNCTVAGNTNYTEQKGGTGDITQFAMGHQCYMKITHPVIDPVVNEYIFAHTVGYLCNTIGRLSNFHGFTMCSNPHINISASDREREEIKQFLEQGVILP